MLRLKKLFLPKKPILADRDLIRLKAEEVLAKDYNFLAHIGTGAYADVLALWSKNGRTTVCAKIMHPLMTSKYEIKLWTKLNHPNVAPVLKLIQNPDVDIFLMPHYPRTLMDVLQKDDFLDDEDSFEMTVHFVENVFSGLKYMHNKKVCHLDLKSNNIMISNENVAVIADFSSIALADTPTDWYALPRYYCPPEAWPLKVDGRSPKVDGRAFDIWSAGMIILNCFTACWMEPHLWGRTNWWNEMHPLISKCLEFDSFQSSLSLAFPRADTKGVPCTRALNMIKGILRYNPEERPSASRILHHIIFTGSGELLEPDKMWAEDVKEVHEQVIKGKLQILMRTAAERIKIMRGNGRIGTVHRSSIASIRLLENTQFRTLFRFWRREKWEDFRYFCCGKRELE